MCNVFCWGTQQHPFVCFVYFRSSKSSTRMISILTSSPSLSVLQTCSHSLYLSPERPECRYLYTHTFRKDHLIIFHREKKCIFSRKTKKDECNTKYKFSTLPLLFHLNYIYTQNTVKYEMQTPAAFLLCILAVSYTDCAHLMLQ